MQPDNRMKNLLRFVFICLFVFQILSAFSQSNQVHVVRKGDNLYRIAKTYNVTVDELKKANHLSSNNLDIGQKIKIPGKASAKKKAEQSKKKTSEGSTESEEVVPEETKTKVPTKTSFPDFNKMQEKTKPGLAEGLLQKTRELMGEKSSPSATETQQTVPEVPAIASVNILPIPKDGYHVVKAKENLFRISQMYGLDMKEIISLNNMTNYGIKKGQKLKLVSDEQLKKMHENQQLQREEEALAQMKDAGEKIVPERIKGEKDSLDLVVAFHVVQRHETLFSISKQFKVTVSELKKLNNLSNNKLFVGQKLYIKVRGKKKPEPEIQATPEEIPQLKDPAHLRNDLERPVIGHIISNFGLRQNRPHKGLDISAPSGTPIYAVLDGRVAYVGMQSGYGNVIVLEHPDFVMTVYAHNERNMVNVGDEVKKGQQIAVVGSTGNATAPHLHFEYRVKGKAIDPKKVLPEY